MLATTRYTYMQEELNCDFYSDPTCAYNVTFEETFYVSDIEHFTLLIDHTVYAPNVDIKENARSLKGSISYFNGSDMHLPPGNPVNQVGVPGAPDIMYLQTLLNAAGITSLDSNSVVNASSTMRYDGIVLMIFIEYTNTKTYNLGDLSYTYIPTLITETEFKSVEPLLGNQTRQVYNRHGIRMIFVQDGLLGKFDIQTTMLTFVTGLGLLTVSTVIVDVIAIYLLPQKRQYEEYKYQRTEKFHWYDGDAPDDENTPINKDKKVTP